MRADADCSNVMIAAARSDPAARDCAQALLRELGVVVVDINAIPESINHVLVVTDERLELRSVVRLKRGGCGAPARGALFVDFSDIDVRTGSGGLSKKQPLVRAFGSRVRTIIDATAGLGHDAFLLACCGFDVTAVERSPIIFVLLRDGVRRAREHPMLAGAMGDRLTVLHADARATLAHSHPDAVYIDPMFPPRRKRSALARKSIRMVRELVGDDPDAGALFDAAMKSARDRVVVKRATEAPPLGDKPDLCFQGKLVRYDVHLVGRGRARSR